MPVQSEYYGKVKPVCDLLAVLASQCDKKEFEKRFDLLEAVCKSWSHPGVQQELPPIGDVIQAHDEVCQQSELGNTTYSEDIVSFNAEETDNVNRPPRSGHGKGELIVLPVFSVFGRFSYCTALC